MRKDLTMKEVMTPSPHTIGEDIALNIAIHRMREFKVRHLPVLKGGKLVGVVTDRDIKLALSVHPEARDLKVSDIMTEDVYAVAPEAPLAEAVNTMFLKGYGSTVVQQSEGQIVGIFTTIDALRVLSRALKRSTAAGENASGVKNLRLA